MVRFVPTATFNGVARLTYRAWDQSTDTSVAMANLGTAAKFRGATAYSSATRNATVLVNDAPTLTATGNNPTLTEGGAAVDLFSGGSASAVTSMVTHSASTGAGSLMVGEDVELELDVEAAPKK